MPELLDKDEFFILGDESYQQFYTEDCCPGYCCHKHARASVDTIRNCIFPPPELPLTLTKNGKPTKHPADPTGHWYCAQVIHYGLKPTFRKTIAKKRLTQALESNTLKVPQRNLDIETQLRQQLIAECIQSKQTASNGNTAHRGTEGDVDLDVETQQLQQYAGDVRPKKFRTKQTARVGICKGIDEPDLYDELLEMCSDREKRLTQLVEEDKLDGKNGPSMNFNLTGVYEVSAPDVTADWGYNDLILELAMSGSELWGWFDFGIWIGILKFEPFPQQKGAPTKPSQVICAIKFDENDNPMNYTGEDVGEITIFPEFKDDKSKTLLITGSLELQGDIPFAARWKSPLDAGAAASIADWKTQWEYCNADAYEDENRER